MKTKLRWSTIAALFALSGGPAWAQEAPLPACAAGDDYDQDGVPNLDDSDETDSCQLDPRATGLTSCETGAGDGEPDCLAP